MTTSGENTSSAQSSPDGLLAISRLPSGQQNTPSGLLLQPGGTGQVSSYSIVFDVYVPASSAQSGQFSFFQANSQNNDDAEISGQVSGDRYGVGTGGEHYGFAQLDAWNRIGVTVQTNADGTVTVMTYINGDLAAEQIVPSTEAAKFVIDRAAGFFIFTDNDGEDSPGYASNVLFVETVLSSETMAALGGTQANGILPDAVIDDYLQFNATEFRFDANSLTPAFGQGSLSGQGITPQTTTASQAGIPDASVVPVDNAPTTAADTGSVNENQSAVFDLLANDSDPNSSALTLVGFSVTGVNGFNLGNDQAEAAFTIVNNKLVANPGSAFAALEDGQSARVLISYVVRNAQGEEAVGTAVVTVNGYSLYRRLTGTSGNDILVGTSGKDWVEAGAGNDQVTAGDDDDIVEGGAGDDVLDGGAGADILKGGAGNDRLIGGTGVNTLNGGDGVDTAVFSGNRVHYEVTFKSAADEFNLLDRRSTLADRAELTAVEKLEFADQTVTSQDLSGYLNIHRTYTGPADTSAGAKTVLRWNTAGSGVEVEIKSTNSSGYQTSGTTIHANGSKTIQLWDRANTQNWSTYIDRLDAQNRRYSQEGTYDAGGKWLTSWDVANSYNWSTYTDYYNANNIRYQQNGDYDDNRKWYTYWDATNTNTYSTFTDYYDAAGRRTSQDGYYDNGGRWIYTWDQAGSYNWWEVLDIYNAAGQRTNQNGTYDNGIKWYYTWDVSGSYSWSQILELYDAYGRHTSSHVNNDDGTKYDYFLDAANADSWSSYYNYYNTYGSIYQKLTYFDSGDRMEENWDPQNQYFWEYSYWYYNSAGYLINAYAILDGGGVSYGVGPVALDLNGDGVDLIAFGQSTAGFDWDGDGTRQQTAWVGPQDGFLAIDLAADGSAGPDGVIDQRKELAFTDWAAGTKSDLEGLRIAFDSNGDGVLDNRDARWSEFRIWQDLNQDGKTDAGELKTLDEWGISSISLTGDRGDTSIRSDGSHVSGTIDYTRDDGTSGKGGDVSLTIEVSDMVGGAGDDILTGGRGDNRLTGGSGSDVFVFASGFGKDTITDFVAGSGATDVIQIDDAVFADLSAVLAAATQVGADTVITYDANNMITLKNVTKANLHADDFQFV
ncbi:calcium-binding protein [Bosea sp. NPDC055332]